MDGGGVKFCGGAAALVGLELCYTYDVRRDWINWNLESTQIRTPLSSPPG